MEDATALELEVAATRRRLQELERRLSESRGAAAPQAVTDGGHVARKENVGGMWKSFVSAAESLTKADVERYSRQMMVEGVGATGMERIRRGRVLLVGAGGLGSTIALFLAAAGVGELQIVDFDVVELSNLHRQVIHTTDRVGWKKVQSAASACNAINPDTVVVPLPLMFDASNAEDLVRDCDVVVDGTDNVAARYLINDAAARQQKPVVSGSAMRWDGQLSVYGYNGGPCLRCLFPVPPPLEAVGSCNDTGVMGPVPGCIGSLQAMEVLKILAQAGDVLSGRMLVFDGLRFRMRVVQLRGRQASCPACGDAADNSSGLQQLLAERPEYIGASCVSGSALSAQRLLAEARSSPKELFACLQRAGASAAANGLILLDVRVRQQYDMAHLPTAVSLPLTQLKKWQLDGVLREEWDRFASCHLPGTDGCVTVFVLCRRGVWSAEATQILLSLEPHCGAGDGGGVDAATRRYRFLNVDGGLNRYHQEADNSFPFY
ncbi:putative ubiquitin activating enzyme [Trypanosoma conorhini]|uniref:Adenylyltransferase and sulfurtransferase MOCS3 homolog n=1 Tax=Trypanosoma conorhini TaxID=83891 RepID=A0A422PJS5_9TRYP|nr:putative ubiquitin activating enzyme [Trypanosoma conorhini]RNF17969.1 putative ubiquitin activating enzyme [Trypanosoma conorhini]